MIKRTHTKTDAEYCLWYFKKHICGKSVLVGSFGKGKNESKKDIDIYISSRKKTVKLRERIKNLIDAERVESTDWGGWFFHNSRFGNVDVFFDISKFDF